MHAISLLPRPFHHQLLSLFSLALLGVTCSGALGQTTKYSSIVGFSKVTVKGTSAGTGENFIGPAFLEEKLYQGAIIAGVPLDNTLEVADAEWAVDEFNTNGAVKSHFVEIVASSNPAAVGRFTDILSNTATKLTTADNLSSLLAGGETIAIRAHTTLGKLFGEANEAGWEAGTSTEADRISVLTPGVNAVFSSYYFRDGGLGGAGWRTTVNPFVDQMNRPIRIGEGLLIQRQQAASVDLVLMGHVHEGVLRLPIVPGFNLVDPVAPITDQTTSTPIVGAALTLGGTISSTTIPSGLGNLFQSGTATEADVINLHGSQGFTSYYLRGVGLLGGAGWRNTSNPFENKENVVIPPATSVLFQIQGTGGEWIRPQPFTIP